MGWRLGGGTLPRGRLLGGELSLGCRSSRGWGRCHRNGYYCRGVVEHDVPASPSAREWGDLLSVRFDVVSARVSGGKRHLRRCQCPPVRRDGEKRGSPLSYSVGISLQVGRSRAGCARRPAACAATPSPWPLSHQGRGKAGALLLSESCIIPCPSPVPARPGSGICQAFC